MLPVDLKNQDLKKKTQLDQRQIANKFPNIGIFLFPWKNVTFLVCQILDICNYEVLFDQKWSLANITRFWKITVFYDEFHHVLFFFFFFFGNCQSKNFHLV